MKRRNRDRRTRKLTMSRRRCVLERLENRHLLAVVFADSFEAGGGTGDWAGNWVEDAQNDWFRSTQRATDGSYSAEVDGSASNDSSNLMEAVRHALMINRLTYGAAAVSHLDTLRWATQGSASCLGRTDIGEIAVGKQADLALFKLDELRFSGAGDPLAALVLCGAHRADRVMVAGRWQVVNGFPLDIDTENLKAVHQEAAARFLNT